MTNFLSLETITAVINRIRALFLAITCRWQKYLIHRKKCSSINSSKCKHTKAVKKCILGMIIDFGKHLNFLKTTPKKHGVINYQCLTPIIRTSRDDNVLADIRSKHCCKAIPIDVDAFHKSIVCIFSKICWVATK